jgi:hypothetical protein
LRDLIKLKHLKRMKDLRVLRDLRDLKDLWDLWVLRDLKRMRDGWAGAARWGGRVARRALHKSRNLSLREATATKQSHLVDCIW